ncbi:MAG: glycosyltransferase family 39 protein, partial [Microbacteriaceae bacterium]
SRLAALGRALVRGRASDAAWVRPALLALLVGTGALYTINLTANGWANSFYAAAVQAGTQNWEAFFYGSSDAGNSITVDKPPASLWIMGLSARVFGLSSFSILFPEVLMGVATVGVTYLTVRRHFSPRAALAAGGILALTPVAALMFRYDNPDALLVLLTALASYFTLRAVEDGRLRWVLWAGAMVGLGFLTKQLQAFLVLPVLAAVFAWASPLGWRRRLVHLGAALGAVVVSAGWWVAIVELVPASWRPYIGGSQDNDFLELTFGYNGFGRLTGEETGSVTGGRGGGAGAWGDTGILRLFGDDIAGQIAWLLPAALVLAVIGIVLLRRAPRVSPARATLVILAGTMIVTALAFSFMAGIFHSYYTVALAPPIAGTVAIGASLLWARRSAWWARIAVAAIVLGTAGWSFALLSLSSDFLPWLKYPVLGVGLATAVVALFAHRLRSLAVATLAGALLAGLAGPLAYTIDTIATAHTGSLPTAGPSTGSSGHSGSGHSGSGHGGSGHSGSSSASESSASGGSASGGSGSGHGGSGHSASERSASVHSGGGGSDGAQSGAGQQQDGRDTGGSGQGGSERSGYGGSGDGGSGSGGSGSGGSGSLLGGGGSASSEVVALLEEDADDYTWVAATTGSNNAAKYQLASGGAVMPVGGYNGSDPSPTLEQFEQYVADGEIHYYIAGSVGASNGGSDVASQIAEWVEDNFTAQTIDGVTVYDLSSGASSSSDT